MSSTTMSTPMPIKLLLGPILVGTILNTCLYGICVSQFTTYFLSKRRLEDSIVVRYLVVWEGIINTFHTALFVYLIWLYMVDNYLNGAFVLSAPWPITAVPLLTTLSATPIQIFMAYRVLRLSQSPLLFAFLAIITLTNGAIAVVTSVLAFAVHIYYDGSRLTPLVNSWVAVMLLNDLSLTMSLVFYLNKNRTGLFHKTKNIVRRLTRSTLESAAFGSLFSIMVLITFTKFPKTALHLVFSAPMGRIYASTLLSTLNRRESLREDLAGTNLEFGESLNFHADPSSCPSNTTASTIAANITQDQELEADSSRKPSDFSKPEESSV
ncbi:hypothetical protein MVEN_00784200 [Mycena venus]|uniref:DUF6534 domain-containing protein n=1 Tax=Mycena venus TaxID=2733690 RepID=A0A8H6YL07_9AGAR|nr:hypothetical protein MVEN_00784200 [Mycena venus]